MEDNQGAAMIAPMLTEWRIMVKGYWPEDIKARNGSPPGPYVPMSDYDELLAENAKQHARIAELEADIEGMIDPYDNASTRIATLEAALSEANINLRKYGGHTVNCAYHLSHHKGQVSQCDCKWIDLLPTLYGTKP
jgi:hypothetical protein